MSLTILLVDANNEAVGGAVALRFALERICAYTGWPVGQVYLPASDGAEQWAPTGLWHLVAPARFAAFQQAMQTVQFASGDGMVGRVGASGQPEWSVEVVTDPVLHRRQAAVAARLKAGFAFPLLVGRDMVGVLAFYAPEMLPPDAALLKVMLQVGARPSRAVERQRAAEQEQRQQEALLQHEKLATMGALLASVAHELNNPLAIILMQADNVREEVEGSPAMELIEEITQAAERCQRLVHNFLPLARQHPPGRVAVDLNTLITSSLGLLAPQLRVDNIAVHLHLAEGLPPLWADLHQLQQAVMNLVTNPQQSFRDMPEPRQVTLMTRYDPARTRLIFDVADTGPGISPALQARIFEPFITTRPPGISTGLGLWLCRGIIEGHGETIRVMPQPDEGATFRVELPTRAVLATTSTTPDKPAPQAGHGKAILIVDDEPSITNGLARLLRRDGYCVDTAANGRLALAKLRERPYDLVLSDLRMPELDGPGLCRVLERQYPHLCRRLIFLTGDTMSPETLAFLERVDVPRLTKPFTAAEARRVVQQALQAL
jgi:signal transduction histidine kinase